MQVMTINNLPIHKFEYKYVYVYIYRGSNGSRLKAIRMQVMTLNNLPYVPAKLVKEINSKDDPSSSLDMNFEGLNIEVYMYYCIYIVFMYISIQVCV
jgi:hypothetical protein